MQLIIRDLIYRSPLKTFKVVQSRGVCNENTEYHDRIISLVDNNMCLIRKRMRTKKAS